jgi:hypothetical protein
MKRILFIASLLLVAGLLAATTLTAFVAAQSKAPAKAQAKAQAAKPQAKPQAAQPAAMQPRWSQVMIVRVRPEMAGEYQEFVKSETIPMQQKAGTKWRDTWVTAGFGEALEYAVITPIEDFAQYDGPPPYVRALGEEGGRKYLEKVRKLLNSSHTYAMMSRPDLSNYTTPETQVPKLVILTRWQVAPGRAMEYETILKNEVLPLVKKHNIGYWVSQITLGGGMHEYATAMPQESFAEIGKGNPILRAIGQDAYNRLVMKTAGVVTGATRTVIRYVPELSYRMPRQTAENK